MSQLDDIQLAVERSIGVKSAGVVSHRESVPVVETFQGKVVWEGVVQVFDIDALDLDTAYGWAVDNGNGEPEYVTVRGRPPINSPLDAVRAWLVSLTRK